MSSTPTDESACCKQGTPVDVTPGSVAKGTVVKDAIPGMDLYCTGTGRRVGIVAAYDIFGFDVEQTRQFCDELAAATDGFVVMPDYFRGNAWKQFPIEDTEKFHKWIAEVAGADKAARDTLDLVLPWLRQRLASSDCSPPLAVIGFCWGGWLVALLLAEPSLPFACGVGLHPSRQSAEDIGRVRAPIALFPAENDPEMAAFLDAIPDRDLAAKCLHKRFLGVKHGWCTKRSDPNQPDTVTRVKEANADTAAFILDRTRKE